MALPEIHWTPSDGDYSDFIPGHLTQVTYSDDEVRIGFAGEQGPGGDRYDGVLIIKLREGVQTVQGKQSYKPADEPWEPVPFSLVGQFEDGRFTRFTGMWAERGKSYRLEIVDLPMTGSGRPPKSLKPSGSGKRKPPSPRSST